MTPHPLITALPHIPRAELEALRPIQVHRLLTAFHRGWHIDYADSVWCLTKQERGRTIKVSTIGIVGLNPLDIN